MNIGLFLGEIGSARDHAHPIALGVHPKFMVAELYGKKTWLDINALNNL